MQSSSGAATRAASSQVRARTANNGPGYIDTIATTTVVATTENSWYRGNGNDVVGVDSRGAVQDAMAVTIRGRGIQRPYVQRRREDVAHLRLICPCNVSISRNDSLTRLGKCSPGWAKSRVAFTIRCGRSVGSRRPEGGRTPHPAAAPPADARGSPSGRAVEQMGETSIVNSKATCVADLSPTASVNSQCSAFQPPSSRARRGPRQQASGSGGSHGRRARSGARRGSRPGRRRGGCGRVP